MDLRGFLDVDVNTLIQAETGSPPGSVERSLVQNILPLVVGEESPFVGWEDEQRGRIGALAPDADFEFGWEQQWENGVVAPDTDEQVVSIETAMQFPAHGTMDSLLSNLQEQGGGKVLRPRRMSEEEDLQQHQQLQLHLRVAKEQYEQRKKLERKQRQYMRLLKKQQKQDEEQEQSTQSKEQKEKQEKERQLQRKQQRQRKQLERKEQQRQQEERVRQLQLQWEQDRERWRQQERRLQELETQPRQQPEQNLEGPSHEQEDQGHQGRVTYEQRLQIHRAMEQQHRYQLQPQQQYLPQPQNQQYQQNISSSLPELPTALIQPMPVQISQYQQLQPQPMLLQQSQQPTMQPHEQRPCLPVMPSSMYQDLQHQCQQQHVPVMPAPINQQLQQPIQLSLPTMPTLVEQSNQNEDFQDVQIQPQSMNQQTQPQYQHQDWFYPEPPLDG